MRCSNTLFSLAVLVGACGGSPPPQVANVAPAPAAAPEGLLIPDTGQVHTSITVDGTAYDVASWSVPGDDGAVVHVVVSGPGMNEDMTYESAYRDPTFTLFVHGSSFVVEEEYILCAGTFDEDCDNVERGTYDWNPEVHTWVFDDGGDV